MELGNAIFGNSRGNFHIDRWVGWEGELSRLFRHVQPDENSTQQLYGMDFENDTFMVMPYYWGDCTCEAGDDDNEHEKTCMLLKPNFLHKPSGFSISWYKYPLRDSYKSHDITLGQFEEIIDECIRSLKNV